MKNAFLSVRPLVAFLIALGLGLALSEASSPAQPPSPAQLGSDPGQASVVPNGVWGGARSRLEISATGGSLESGCFFATFSGAIPLNPDGTFTVQVMVTTFGLPSPPFAATLTGGVQGTTTNLQLHFPQSESAAQDFIDTLTLGVDQPPGGPQC
jgi:hypothetical protein